MRTNSATFTTLISILKCFVSSRALNVLCFLLVRFLMLKLLLIFKHQVAYHHTILFISYFFKKISPNRIIYDLIYNEIQNKGRFGDKTKCFLYNNNFLSQIIPFCERANRLKKRNSKAKIHSNNITDSKF